MSVATVHATQKSARFIALDSGGFAALARHAEVSVPPGTAPLPYTFLDPFFGDSGKGVVEMFSAYAKIERLAFRMNASCSAKRAHRLQIPR